MIKKKKKNSNEYIQPAVMIMNRRWENYIKKIRIGIESANRGALDRTEVAVVWFEQK